MATVEPHNDGLAGATQQTKDAKDLIFQYAWYQKKQGRAETTITSCRKLLNVLVKRGANLNDPESVKEVIANQQWSAGRKDNAADAYTGLLRMMGYKWDKPRYKRVKTDPYIPSETEVDQLIAGCSKKVSTLLQMLKETGMRPGEAWLLGWTDLDFDKNTVRVTPEKGSNPRTLRMSNKLISMLNLLTRKNEYVFRNGLVSHFTDGFRQQRKRMAIKLGNPKINLISLRTLRHYKGTAEYRRTKSVLHVMDVLGDKSVKNAMVYMHLADLGDDDFVTQVAKTSEEACKLIEAGFDYVFTAPDSLMIFRKRK